MAEPLLFLQNVIAVIWDFDKTLSPYYMQRPIFEEYGVDEKTFWEEVNALPAYYAKAGIHVQEDTCYLGHLLSYVKHGRMPGLTNDKLCELGDRVTFFPGLPEFFGRLQRVLDKPEYKAGDLRLEHYIVSTGLEAMIRGSKVAPYVDGVWASAFIEEPALPGGALDQLPLGGPISHIAGFLDNTTKTRALFEINKGVNKESSIKVNTTIPEEARRVPFKNMIYVADGPSDIPSFSVVRKHGGKAFAVHDLNSDESFAQAVKLLEDGRVDGYAAADYSPGADTDKWLRLQVEKMAERIMEERRRATESRLKSEPTHLPGAPQPPA